jgi:septum formation protein
MRPFSDDFLDQYLAALGERACETVGVYHLEGLGAQLFSQISGDFFTILGLPLVPLMGFLRAHGVLVE